MSSLKSLIPPAKSTTTRIHDHSKDPWFTNQFTKSDADQELEKQQIRETTKETKAAFEKKQSLNYSKYIKYKPSASYAKQRIIRMKEMHVDPLDLPKFKHKRVPKASSGSLSVPVTHSPPPRYVTVKNQQEWNIPPCISRWENPRGYVVPLQDRLAAYGEGLYEVEISDNFAKVSETLYAAEQKARAAVLLRSKVQDAMAMKEKEKKEQELRDLAQKARCESEREGRKLDVEGIEREKIREEHRRDRERDVSEKVALGMASSTGGCEVMYDERLFNQEKGMDSSFVNDDQYNVYENRLFTAESTLSTMYKPKKDMEDDEMYGNGEEQLDKVKNTERYKPDKAFSGPKRERPVEFEKEAEEDSFVLGQWACDLKKR